MSRLLTLLLLYQNGFEVGKYISVEKEIEKTKDVYYDVLEGADFGWHEEKNDYTPFIRYIKQPNTQSPHIKITRLNSQVLSVS